MFQSGNDQFFSSALFQSFGRNIKINGYQFVAGGCINNTVRLDTDEGYFFMKWNQNEFEDMFEKEEHGLQTLQGAESVSVPSVHGCGKVDQIDFLILEYIEKSPPESLFWENFGANLAKQHKVTSDSYGLDVSNYIGRLPQKNVRLDNWIDFFIENRLEVQLGMALYNHEIDNSFMKRFRMIYSQLPGLIPDYPPSLLHGDLWSGNYMVGPNGKAIIFDPAVYFGHREMEIAFSRLFGGFDQRFYAAYNEEFPMDPGIEDRIEIYNLYPLLVHVNLFGSSYLSGIERTLRKFS